MSTNAYVIRDSATMLRRNFRHVIRYPSVSLLVVTVPVILLLLFVYVFGGTLGAGLGPVADGRAAYLDYVVPGILLIAVAGAIAGHGDLCGDGHDRGDHRPLPHDGDRPVLRAARPRPRQHDPDRGRPGGRGRRRRPDRLPAERDHRRVDRDGRCAGDDHVRDHVAVGGARAVPQDRGGREQPPDAVAAPAVPEQWVRSHGVDARGRAAGSPSTSPSHRSSRPCAGS